MKHRFTSDSSYLLAYFLTIIAAGTALLCLPQAWNGAAATGGAAATSGTAMAGTLARRGSLPFIDALFTATSAVCVTGLTTVDTASFSRFGQIVILALIQVGGLGIISFTSLMLMMPGHRLPLRRLGTIRGLSVDGVEHDPLKIVRDIILFTLFIEAAGAAALYPIFSRAGAADCGFTAVFHSISAFCNAGFSPFPNSLEDFRGNPLLLTLIAFLIITGGIGFIVLQDLFRRFIGRKRRLSYHSKLVLSATAVLVISGAAAFLLLEGNNTFAGMNPLDRAANALFQSVTPRTAGFNAVHQADLRQSSKFITILLMFIGGAPGSIAGGIKISTAFIVLLAVLKRGNELGEINVISRRFTPAVINSAVTYFIKALFLLVFAAGILSLIEGPRGARFSQIIFEVTSAFGTVGLSLDLTSTLSDPGKLVIICTMFTGRVGLLAFVFLGGTTRVGRYVYPEADVLFG